MAEWSDWYPLTYDSVQAESQDLPGVYQIALAEGELEYGSARSPIIYIEATYRGTLRTQLLEEVEGSGSPCVFDHLSRQPLIYRELATAEPEQEEEAALAEFEREFGTLPACNKQ